MVYIVNLFTNLKTLLKMEEKNLTEKESLSIITAMISRTKERYIGDGNIMLMWGWLTIVVASLVWLMVYLTHSPAWNWLWFLLPAIGGVATPIMAKKSERKQGVKTYSDKISSQIWLTVGIIAMAATIICLGFSFAGRSAWNLMFVYAMIIVPFAEIAQGIVVNEKSLIAGGACGMAAGLFTTSCLICGVKLYAFWFLPLFMVSFACMMLIPGYIINYKSRRQ